MTRVRYYKTPVKGESEHRRPLADLQNNFRETVEIYLSQKNEKPIEDKDKEKEEKSENVNPVFRNELKKGCEKQEININVKPKVGDQTTQSTENDINFNTNPMLIREIYFHMKELENKNEPLVRTSTYKVSKEMRSSFIDWCIYTSLNFELDNETFHLAVYYADKYLSKEETGVECLLLVGTCAILLACKQEEARNNIPEMDGLIKNLAGVFRKHEILKMEKKMLKVLDFKLSYSTAYQFLEIFCSMCNIKGEEKFLAQYICDMAILHEEIYFNTQPSRIAAASLALSNYLLNINPRCNDIEVLSGYDESNLIITAKMLFANFDKIDSRLSHLISKYSSPKYGEVSTKIYRRPLRI